MSEFKRAFSDDAAKDWAKMNTILTPFIPNEPVYEYLKVEPEVLVGLAESFLSDEVCYAALVRNGRYGDFSEVEAAAINGHILKYVKREHLERLYFQNANVAVALARLFVTNTYEIGTEKPVDFIRAKYHPQKTSSYAMVGGDWRQPNVGDVNIIVEDIERRPWIIDIIRRGAGGVHDEVTDEVRAMLTKVYEPARAELGDELTDDFINYPLLKEEYIRYEVFIRRYIMPKYGLSDFPAIFAIVQLLLQRVHGISHIALKRIEPYERFSDIDLVEVTCGRLIYFDGAVEGDYA